LIEQTLDQAAVAADYLYAISEKVAPDNTTRESVLDLDGETFLKMATSLVRHQGLVAALVRQEVPLQKLASGNLHPNDDLGL